MAPGYFYTIDDVEQHCPSGAYCDNSLLYECAGYIDPNAIKPYVASDDHTQTTTILPTSVRITTIVPTTTTSYPTLPTAAPTTTDYATTPTATPTDTTTSSSEATTNLDTLTAGASEECKLFGFVCPLIKCFENVFTWFRTVLSNFGSADSN